MLRAETQQVIDQVERIADSPVLHNSESLCNLLRFLARHSLESPATPIKEHQIAVEVFHRHDNFDPRLDSTVRVQTSRLRTKLAEYYSASDDPLILEIPKGSYGLMVKQRRAAETAPASPPAGPRERAAEAQQKASFDLAPAHLWLGAGLVVLTALITWGLTRPSSPSAPKVSASTALDTFWAAYRRGSEKPLIIFSNAEFSGRPETGLRYLDREQTPSAPVLDHYTGVGEVMSIQELALLFFRRNESFSVKRSRLLHWDDTKNRDLIFIGSPTENLSLRELPLAFDFRFETVRDGPRKGDLSIANLHPQPGEPDRYLGSKDLPITRDYAIISMFPGPASPQSVLLLAGTTTFGTQAAAEFVCREATVAEILAKNPGGTLKPFSSVIEVEIKGGVPVRSRLAAYRQLNTR
ncbi:MAG: hypothetical protein K2X35_17320 [Bryobacteraceae bacterium]|nr:hypothetical protein [Bryobacteraceae bacterium]